MFARGLRGIPTLVVIAVTCTYADHGLGRSVACHSAMPALPLFSAIADYRIRLDPVNMWIESAQCQATMLRKLIEKRVQAAHGHC